MIPENMDYTYDRTASQESAAAKALNQHWNNLHDFEYALEQAAHEYDAAASYQGKPGEAEAKAVLKAINEARRALEALSKDTGPLGKVLKADQSFTKDHGTPKNYADKVRREIYPR